MDKSSTSNPKSSMPLARKVVGTSTWKINNEQRPHGVSESLSKFVDPVETKKYESTMWNLPKLHALETERKTLRNAATDKFVKIACKNYGSTENLFKAFNKVPSDRITLEEFSSQLKNRNLDIFLPRDEQRLMFEQVSKLNCDAAIEVKDVIAQLVPMTETHTAGKSVKLPDRTAEDVKLSIAQELIKKRQTEKLHVGRAEMEKQLQDTMLQDGSGAGTSITAKGIKAAIGPKALNLPVSTPDLSLLIDDVEQTFGHKVDATKEQNNISLSQFTRYLNMNDLDLDTIPLHDSRQSYISRLQHRIQLLETECTKPELLDRVQELEDTLSHTKPALPAGVTQKVSVSPTICTSPLRPRTSSCLSSISLPPSGRLAPLAKSYSGPQLNDLSNNSGDVAPQGRHSLSLPNSRQQKRSEKELGDNAFPSKPSSAAATFSSRSNRYDDMPRSGTRGGGVARSSPGLGGTYSIQEDYEDPVDPQEFTIQSTMTDTLHAHGTEYNKPKKGNGRKIDPMRSTQTDWTRVGVGSDGTSRDAGIYMAPDRQFQTSSSSSFMRPKEIQKAVAASVGVDVNSNTDANHPRFANEKLCVGEAEVSAKKRADLRNKRYARQVANYKVTEDRMEFEQLENELKDLRTCQHSAKGMLRYASTVYMRDVKELNRQPLVQMSRKANPTQYGFMWNGTFQIGAEKRAESDLRKSATTGSLRGFSTVNGHEDRDFGTTSTTTFNRDQLDGHYKEQRSRFAEQHPKEYQAAVNNQLARDAAPQLPGFPSTFQHTISPMANTYQQQSFAAKNIMSDLQKQKTTFMHTHLVPGSVSAVLL